MKECFVGGGEFISFFKLFAKKKSHEICSRISIYISRVVNSVNDLLMLI